MLKNALALNMYPNRDISKKNIGTSIFKSIK